MTYLFFIIALVLCGTTAFGLRLISKPHKNVLLENTLAPEHLDDPSVHSLITEFRKRILQIVGTFSVASLLFLFNLSDSIILTLFWLYMAALLGTAYLVQVHYIGKMRQLILANGWELPIDPIRIDTKLVQAKNKRMLPWYSLVPAGILLMISLYQAWHLPDLSTGYLMGGVSLAIFALFIYLWVIISRLPVRGISGDSAIDQHINDLTKRYWSLLIAVTCTITLLLLTVPLASMSATGAFSTILLLLFVVLVVFLIVFTFFLLLDLRKKQDQLLEPAGQPRYYGEDAYWRYGFYINPNEARLFVPDRVGMNIGINLGKRSGQIVAGITAVFLLVLMVGTIIPMYRLDFAPDAITGEVQGQEVTFDAPMTGKTTVSLADIETVELIEALPSPRVRTMGVGTASYQIGKFTVAGDPARMFVDINSTPILKVTTKDGPTVFYTNKKAAETTDLYEELVQKISSAE
ncbi:hypothetical protein ACFDAA_15145 [Enterococcus casseliflavus]|uniref:hypothetical protein n=1 Tax=Enterococcus TaxID=1350 RepID=UPI0039A67FAC